MSSSTTSSPSSDNMNHAASLAAASAPFASCPLLRSLQADRDAQFELLRFLTLDEIGVLARSHRMWSVWLNTDRALSTRSREVHPSRFGLLLACPWAVRSIDELSLIDQFDCGDESQHAKASSELCYALSATSQRMTHLIDLAFFLTSAAMPEGLLGKCLFSLPHLRSLVVTLENLPDGGGAIAANTQQVLNGLRSHPTLRTLRFVGLFDRAAEADLSALPSLPQLTHLEMIEDWDYTATVAQLECISRCLALTTLGFGNWCVEDTTTDGEADDSTVEERLERSIGMLVRRQDRSNPDSANSAALTSIRWYATRMTPALWQYVTKLTTLEDLNLGPWDAGMTAAQWSQLSSFPHLKSIRIYPVSDDEGVSTIGVGEFLPALLQVKTLEQLRMGDGLMLTAAHLQSIASGLPKLALLQLCCVRVASLAPLQNASALAELILIQCTGVGGEPVQLRVGFPALPNLRVLEIDDCADRTETSEQLAVLNAQIRAACPKLTKLIEAAEQGYSGSDDQSSDANSDVELSGGDDDECEVGEENEEGAAESADEELDD